MSLPWWKVPAHTLDSRNVSVSRQMKVDRWPSKPADRYMMMDIGMVVADGQIADWSIREWALYWRCSRKKAAAVLSQWFDWMDGEAGWPPGAGNGPERGQHRAAVLAQYKHLRAPKEPPCPHPVPIKEPYARVSSGERGEFRVETTTGHAPPTAGAHLVVDHTEAQNGTPTGASGEVTHATQPAQSPEPRAPAPDAQGDPLAPTPAAVRASRRAPPQQPPRVDPAEAHPSEDGAEGGGESTGEALTLPELLEHHPRVLTQLCTGMSIKSHEPSVEGLLKLSTQQLQALPRVGVKSVKVIRAELKERGLRLNDPLKPMEDPRTKQVTDLWAEVHREVWPGKHVQWEPHKTYFREQERAVRIADAGEGWGRDKVPWPRALERIEIAFRAYLGDLGSPQNFPGRPTVEAFVVQLPGRFTGAAKTRRTGRAANGQMATSTAHLDGIGSFYPDEDDNQGGHRV